MTKTAFSSIIENHDGFIVWEDAKHIAFLTPFPNTPGQTVVIPRENVGDYVFYMDDDQYTELMGAAKTVALILEKALGVHRVALVYEGTGVPHVHAKLYPLYGDQASKINIWGDSVEYSETYQGYITTAEGPKMSNNKLREIQQKIIGAQESKDD
jgi:diadenosine tetraphosphate (Ap4A) HIT family hydrolase